MKQSEVKGYSNEQLQDRLAEAQGKYADLRSTHAVTPLDNPSEIRKQRRTIARIKTALNNQN